MNIYEMILAVAILRNNTEMNKKNYKNYISKSTTRITKTRVCLACWYESPDHTREECPRCRGKMHEWEYPTLKTE